MAAVTEGRDLWWSGGGAQNDDLFGFAGMPSGGRRDLAHLVDLSATIAVTRWLTIAGTTGMRRRRRRDTTFAGRDADYGFVETTLRY